MSTLNLHSGTRMLLWGQSGLFSLTRNQDPWSNSFFVVSQPIPGAVTEKKQGYARETSGQAAHQYQYYWWCMSQSKVRLTHPESCQLSRT